MRIQALALALLLCACGTAQDNAAINADADLAAPGAPIDGAVPTTPPPTGAPTGEQPLDGRAAPEPSGEIGLRASPEQLSAGGTVTLTLSNGTREQLGYNLCTSALQTAERREVRSDRICTMEIRTLEPGRTASYSYELPGTLGRGSYRLSTGIDRMSSGTRVTVTSNSFRVR
jgi:hypothetical protein